MRFTLEEGSVKSFLNYCKPLPDGEQEFPDYSCDFFEFNSLIKMILNKENFPLSQTVSIQREGVGEKCVISGISLQISPLQPFPMNRPELSGFLIPPVRSDNLIVPERGPQYHQNLHRPECAAE
jgi:hypothetical protein